MLGAAVVLVAASLHVVDSIRIESRWGGLGVPSAKTYTIVRRGSRYEGTSAVVPRGAVDRLMAAVAAAPVERNAGLRALANREWLTARANEPHDDVRVPVCSAEARRLLAERLADREKAWRAFDHYFSLRWTDDLPYISVDVVFDDRQTVHLESHAQHALMLPWNVGSVETWNPEIPRAIAALLPDDAESRLTDRQLARAYVKEVAEEMRHLLDELEERCVHSHFFAAVEKQFEIVRVYHGSPGAFTAYVRRADFPANLVLTLVIRDADGTDAQAKLDRAVERAGAYVNLVRDYVGRAPGKYFAIWCADGVSVEGNDRAVSISEYDPRSGIVSNPRIVLPDGSVTDEH